MTNLGVYAYWPASFPHDMPSGSDKGTKKTSGHHPACISCHVLVASPSNKPDKGTPRRESRWPRRASLLPTAAAVMTTTTIVSDISDTSAGSGPLGPLIRHWEVTARVHNLDHKAFLSFFLDLFIFWDLFADLARACLGFLERPSRSCEVVRVRSTHGLHNRTAASLDVGGPGPDLTW